MFKYLTAGLIGLSILSMSNASQAQDRIAIGTGGTGGVFYSVGAGVADILSRKLDGVSANAEVTGASVENVRRVSMGEMALGFSSASTLYAGKHGEDPFDEEQNVAAIAYLYPAWLQIAASNSSGAKSIEDLKDLRVSVGPPGSNASVIAERLLEAYDAWDMGSVQFLSYGEATNAIKDSNLDATFVLAGAPASALIELTTSEDATMIPVDAGKLAGMLEEYPYYQVIDIPAGIYRGQDEAVAAVGDPVILFTQADADEEMVYNVTKTIFENLSELGAVHPMAELISFDNATKTPIDLHPGARRFFEGK